MGSDINEAEGTRRDKDRKSISIFIEKMPANSYPRYTDITNSIVPDPPFRLEKALFFNFLIACDQDNLDQLIDQRLNKVSGFNVRFESTAPLISIIFALYPAAYPIRGKEQTGYVPYREVVFMAMVKERKPFWQRNIPVYSYQPAIILDENVAATTGREIFGWPKVHGELFFPGIDGPEQRNFLCRSTTLPGKNSLDPLAVRQPFVEIETPPGFSFPNIEKHISTDPEALIEKYVAQSIESERNISIDVRSMVAKIHRLPVVTFRQFPDPQSPNHALSQSVVKTFQKNITITNGGLLPGDFHLKQLIDTPMFPLKSLLGLRPRILSAYWIEWDFEIHRGEEMWNAAAPRLPWYGNLFEEIFG